VVRRGVVRRAKLYYLRGRTGKRARIAERARESVRPDGGRGRTNAQRESEPAGAGAGQGDNMHSE